MKIVWLVPVVISPLLIIDDLDTKNLITIITAIIYSCTLFKNKVWKMIS